MVALPIEMWTEENSGWASPPSKVANNAAIKGEWGQTVVENNGWAKTVAKSGWGQSDNGGWVQSEKGWGQSDNGGWGQTVAKSGWGQSGWNEESKSEGWTSQPKKWDELEAEDWLANNSFTSGGVGVEQSWGKSTPNWGTKVATTQQQQQKDGHSESWQIGGGGGGSRFSTEYGTILVVSGLDGANVTQDELRFLVNLKAGNAGAYGRHIIGNPFFPPSRYSDTAFFRMNSDISARKAQRGLEGYKIGEGPGGKVLHASIMPDSFVQAGANAGAQIGQWGSTTTNTWMGNNNNNEEGGAKFGHQPTSQWTGVGLANNASMLTEIGQNGNNKGWGGTVPMGSTENGWGTAGPVGDGSNNNFGEDQSEEMAENEATVAMAQHGHVKWKNSEGADEEEEEEEEEDEN